jgi:hypothetical protein
VIWAAAEGLSRSRYVREAALAIPILRRVSLRERLPHTTRAIPCVRALARATTAALDAKTVYRLEAAMAELDVKAEELELHAECIAALLALLPPPHPEPPFDHPLCLRAALSDAADGCTPRRCRPGLISMCRCEAYATATSGRAIASSQSHKIRGPLRITQH